MQDNGIVGKVALQTMSGAETRSVDRYSNLRVQETHASCTCVHELQVEPFGNVQTSGPILLQHKHSLQYMHSKSDKHILSYKGM